MSFYASGSGLIKARSESDCKIIEERNNDNSAFVIDGILVDNKIFVYHPFENYAEECVHDFLRSINENTLYGEIVFEGEENTNWRFKFKDGKWYEENGTITYDEGYPV